MIGGVFAAFTHYIRYGRKHEGGADSAPAAEA